MTGFSDGSGISWTIRKQSAPQSSQITTPTINHSVFTVFTGQMLFLTPNQQCQSTDGHLQDVDRTLRGRVNEYDRGQR